MRIKLPGRLSRAERKVREDGDARNIRRLFGYVRPYARVMVTGLVVTLALNALRSTQPLFTKYAIDLYITPRRMDGLAWLTLAFLGVRFLTFVLFYYQRLLLNTFGQFIVSDLRLELYKKLQLLDCAYFDGTPVGHVLTRLTSDLDATGEIFTSCAKEGLGDVIMWVSMIGIMVWMDWRLALVTLASLPLLWVTMRWFRERAQRGYDNMRMRFAALNAFLQEYLSGALTVQLFNREAKALRKFRSLNDSFVRAANSTGLSHTIFVFMVDMICGLSLTLAIWYGGWRLMRGAGASSPLSMGEFIAFVLYSHQMLQPAHNFSNNYGIFQAALVSLQRIFKTLDHPVTITSPHRPRKSGRALGHIEFRNVWFAYRDEEWVLRDVSFTIEPGQSVAVVGRTGAGKTTLSNLLLRFYDVQRGCVLLDGVDVRDWELQALRENCGLVLQDVFLFSGTVEHNIRAGRGDISRERVEWAARETHADALIKSLPEGYETVVRSDALQISAGQKQLIAFARALVRNPAVLVLDEATSSVDPQTERAIQEATERAVGDRTTLIIAHRLSNVQRADRIIVLHQGEVREEGTHEHLLSLGGLYWRLHRLQPSAHAMPEDGTSLGAATHPAKSIPAMGT
jgi:ATP-binding cassette subfamily B multidrug efflux pump